MHQHNPQATGQRKANDLSVDQNATISGDARVDLNQQLDIASAMLSLHAQKLRLQIEHLRRSTTAAEGPETPQSGRPDVILRRAA